MNHPDLGIIAEYWLGNANEDSIEEHLLECAECNAALEWVIRLSKGITAVARRGNLGWVLTPEFMARLIADGLRVRSYAPPAGGGVQCTVTPQDDLLMGRLKTDLSSVPRLDIVGTGGEGEFRFRLEDVAFRPSEQGEIVLNEPVDPARVRARDVLKVKLVAVETAGERVLGEYTFNHSVPPE